MPPRVPAAGSGEGPKCVSFDRPVARPLQKMARRSLGSHLQISFSSVLEWAKVAGLPLPDSRSEPELPDVI
ncbi:MAG: hypothetical protein F4Y60_09030 [Boseongicola sp. SB0664_bin_43]|uniref:Uncharacterized protein n=1 Tax=Boseongicola sp. SB0664_bin_43 TaxID=2604844 RepID=A0A6B0XZQ0_9RHOB|nr:hypothetical protein [Boseongicola sp. SB0664_bin_43]